MADPIRTAIDAPKSNKDKAIALLAMAAAIRAAYARHAHHLEETPNGLQTVYRLEGDPRIAALLGWLSEFEARARVEADVNPPSYLVARAEKHIIDCGVINQLESYLDNRQQAVRVVAGAAYAIA